ncbi:MAG TPA: hypothetical protein V6C95_11870 [Coleofasciculaceae cyanobacterium]
MLNLLEAFITPKHPIANPNLSVSPAIGKIDCRTVEVKFSYRDYLRKPSRSKVQPAQAITTAVSATSSGRSHNHPRIRSTAGSHQRGH